MPKPKLIVEKLVTKVELKLDGKTWPIVVTHNVLIEVEALTGLNVLRGEANILNPNATLIRALLFAVLQRAKAPFTIEEVGDLITPQNLALVQEALVKGWAASMPEVEAEEERPTKAVGE